MITKLSWQFIAVMFSTAFTLIVVMVFVVFAALIISAIETDIEKLNGESELMRRNFDDIEIKVADHIDSSQQVRGDFFSIRS